MGSAYSTHVRN